MNEYRNTETLNDLCELSRASERISQTAINKYATLYPLAYSLEPSLFAYTYLKGATLGGSVYK